MTVSADVMLSIAADPEHLGTKIAITSVLHTWGGAMMHHPHVHRIVPGGWSPQLVSLKPYSGMPCSLP